MSNKLGFIGCGKMAKAIIKGILASNFLNKSDILASTSSIDSANASCQELGINVINDNSKVAEFADTIIIATKPNQVEKVLDEIKSKLDENKLIISIAAGVSTKKIEAIANNSPVIRVMPNTPALLKQGISAIVRGSLANDTHEKFVEEILSKIGKVICVKEDEIDIVTAISGSGPAFFYQIFEDMAQAGVNLGLDYDKSLLLAVQTALGSAQMVLNRDKSVNDLINSVATKGGCTEVGINTMRNLNSNKVFDEIIKNTAKKAHELG